LSLCLVLVLVYLMMDYLKELRARNTLVDQINTATQTLLLLPDPAKDLAERLKQAGADNQAAKQFVSGSDPDTTEIIALLMKTADDRHLQADPLSSEQWLKNVGTGTYRMLPIELILSGSQADFYLFIADLENRQLFPSLAIEEISITRDNSPGPEAEAIFSVKLSLSLVVRLDVTS
jgi:cytochrome oxidase Cu insertion factor (SCO1/SenC/PrrC family)